MAGLTGNPRSLKSFTAKLRDLPRVVSIKVAENAAPALTAAARSTFSAGENAYGDAWAPKADGSRATLNVSGSLAAGVYYVATGTRIRVALGVRYARYVLGKRPIFPRQGSALPVAYLDAITKSAADTIRDALGKP